MSDDDSNELLREYLMELHTDSKMRKIMKMGAGSATASAIKDLTRNSDELGRNILTAWLEKSGVAPSEEMVSFVTQAFPRLVKRHGFRRGPVALLSLLNDRYGTG